MSIKIAEFYRNVVESIGFMIIDNKLMLDDETPVTTTDGLPLVLPTKDQLNSIVDDSGQVTKIIFNPLIEDANIKSNKNISNKRMLNMAKMNITFKLPFIAKLLMSSLDKPKGSFILNQFYKYVSEFTGTKSNKKIVDEKAILAVNTIFTESYNTELEAIKFTINKTGKIDKATFNYTGSLYSPLLDYIKDEEDAGNKIKELCGVKLRVNDLAIIKALLKFVINCTGDDEDDIIRYGSNSNAASFDALMTLYVTISEFLNTVSETLKDFDLEAYDAAKINLKISSDDLYSIDEYIIKAADLPSEKSLLQSSHVSSPISKMKARQAEQSKIAVNRNNTFIPVSDRSKYSLDNEIYGKSRGNVPAENSDGEPTRQLTAADVLGKITGKDAYNGRGAPIYNELPRLNDYHGRRSDLHVEHIYNEAPEYRRPSQRDIYTTGNSRMGGHYRDEPVSNYRPSFHSGQSGGLFSGTSQRQQPRYGGFNPRR